jgi:hypothetical protein
MMEKTGIKNIYTRYLYLLYARIWAFWLLLLQGYKHLNIA